MHKLPRLVVQAVAFLIAFIGIGWLLDEPTLLWQEAALIFVVYLVVTGGVEAAFGRKDGGADNG